MILISTLLCDRKISSMMVALPGLISQARNRSDVNLYYNIETDDPFSWLDLSDSLERSNIVHAIDYWNVTSTWMARPKFDQDQSRLIPITYARNMALTLARSWDAEYIFFVDGDVIVPPNALEMLLNANKPFIGGTVPGRGVHKHALYIFGTPKAREGQLIQVDHGTCGCMLIHRSLFNYISFRFGPACNNPGVMLSEDPAFCNDAYYRLGIPFWIHEGVICKHWDDPEHPLTQSGVAQF